MELGNGQLAIALYACRVTVSIVTSPLGRHGKMRALDGTRTRVDSLDRRGPLPLGDQSILDKIGISWTDPESNRARVACKATLCTSTQPKVRQRGVEPRSSPWRGDVLPLNHYHFVDRAGFEPATS